MHELKTGLQTSGCVTPRCLEASFQFTHDHDDLQWLSHGACIVGTSLCRQTSPIQQQRGYTHNTRATTCVFIQIISENISLSHGSLFQASEHFKVSYSKQAQVSNTLYKRQSILKNHNSTSRDQIKNQGTALFPEFIN